MTVSVPPELETTLAARAQERQVSPEELVREALCWYLQFSGPLLDELTAWQEVRDEALQLIEDARP